MTAITMPSSRIRKIDLHRDLLSVADLIEICFASTLDEDGKDYLRNLRAAARDASTLSWLQGAAERIAAPLYGFVWEENGRIVGNLSLIPVIRRGMNTYLIANVAVHPDYRGRGIGHELTRTAVEHVRQRGLSSVWLQVRDDNPIAFRLYLSLGFVERARRTTWISGVSAPNLWNLPDGITVQKRRGSQDWEQQRRWLSAIYPQEVYWNLPISYSRLRPDLLKEFWRWLQGERLENWVALAGERPIGFLSWEAMQSASDSLWLATPPEDEERAILALLPYAREALAYRRRSLSLNYPAGRGQEAIQRAGFHHHQTLIWMEALLK